MLLFLWKRKQFQRGQVTCLKSHSYRMAEFRLLAPSSVLTPLPFLGVFLCRIIETSAFLGLIPACGFRLLCSFRTPGKLLNHLEWNSHFLAYKIIIVPTSWDC